MILTDNKVEFTAHQWTFFSDEKGQIVDDLYRNDKGNFCFSWVEYVLFKVYYDQTNDGFYLISHNNEDVRIDISKLIEERVADHYRDDPDECDVEEILVKIYVTDSMYDPVTGDVKPTDIRVTVDDFHCQRSNIEPNITHFLNTETFEALKGMSYNDVRSLTNDEEEE